MFKEFRYTGTRLDNGATVRGVCPANNLSTARHKINELAVKNNFVVNSIEKKKMFLYKGITSMGNKVSGEQEAYSKEELYRVLEGLNMSNIKIEPMLLDIRIKPPFADVVMFITLSSEMLKENMRYDEVLKILGMDMQNKTLKRTIKYISRDLKQGQDGAVVFMKYSDIFGRFTSYMLGLASKSGNMAQIYDNTAKYLERQHEFRKNVKQALVMPTITMIAIIIAIAYYVGVLFPQITEMFIQYNIDLPPMTAATLQVSYFLQDNWWWMILLFFTPIFAIGYWFSTPKGRLFRDRMILKLPLVGTLLHKMSIEIFFRVFSTVYTGAGNNMEVIQLSAEACGNQYMEKQVKEITIPRMLKDGAGLIEALAQSGVFTETVISRLNAGSATGSVKKSAEQIAIYYEKETGYRFRTILNSIDVTTAIIIMVVMTFLIIVSSESAFIRPPTHGF
ncbi:MAG: type II secretion system F family protein [Candidatus Cloacimonetes bacterium]|nr:type II secretion system F family protein [Candidatus Cloacimonadota bacterium]